MQRANGDLIQLPRLQFLHQDAGVGAEKPVVILPQQPPMAVPQNQVGVEEVRAQVQVPWAGFRDLEGESLAQAGRVREVLLQGGRLHHGALAGNLALEGFPRLQNGSTLRILKKGKKKEEREDRVHGFLRLHSRTSEGKRTAPAKPGFTTTPAREKGRRAARCPVA